MRSMKRKMRRKTIRRSAVSTIAMVAGNEKTIDAVILDGTVRRWVGIGWVDEGKPSREQRRDLPVVVD